jgi:hypothetical protein
MALPLIALVLALGPNFTSTDGDGTVASVNPKTATKPYVPSPDAPALQKRAAQGAPYKQQLGGYSPAAPSSGSSTLGSTLPPPNDDCNTPATLTGTGAFAFDNSNATTGTQGQGPFQCMSYGPYAVQHDIWFTWTAPGTSCTIVETCGGTFVDTKIVVYSGSGCPATGSDIACNDDDCGLQSRTFFQAIAGQTYTIQLGTYPGASGGTGTFSITQPSPGAGNDDCSAPTVITGLGVFPFDTTNATTGCEGQSEVLCSSYSTTALDHDVWFQWVAPASGFAVCDTCGLTSVDTKIAAYQGSGCPSPGSALACADNSCPGHQAALAWGCVAGATYMIQVGTASGAAGGPGSFSLNVVPPPSNDSCSSPTPISGNGTFAFDNTGATTGTQGQTEALCLAFGTTAITNDVWFVWTAPGSGTATFSLCGGSGMDSKIAAYAGSNCPLLGTALACNDDTCAYQSEVTFHVTGSSTYMLQLGNYPGAGGAVGSFTLDVPGGGGVTYLCDPGSVGAIACPCANPPSGGGRGCDNSSATGGASISGSGSNSLATPTLVFTTAGEKPTATSMLLQGTAGNASGLVFGQGVRCAAGVLKRLYVKTASGGSITAPNFGGGDLDIPTRSSNLGGPISAGQNRWYMVYYRDPIVLGGCPALATFNSTNTARVTWLP